MRNQRLMLLKKMNFYLTRDKYLSDHNIRIMLAYQNQGMSYQTIKKRLCLPYTELREVIQLLYKMSTSQYHELTRVLTDFQVLEMFYLLKQFRMKIIEQFSSKVIYPLVCLIISYVINLFLITTLIPNISSFTITLESNAQLSGVWIIGLWGMILIKSILVIGMLVLFLLMRKTQNLIILITILRNKFSLEILKVFYTSQHSIILKYFLDNGCSTYEMISTLRMTTKNKLLKWHLYYIQDELDRGATILEAYNHCLLDADFQYFHWVGVNQNDLRNQIEDYLSLAETKMIAMIRKYTNILRMMSFIDISLIIIVMFQVISQPLEIMSQF